ncbi:hypothetical protein AAF712_008067 [Marasmius tenuissimus]|uniref:Uncharacterized protein n=1 Tax=Marasmius tenuissimus TaxID=585030 RepID=A0ABR2ZUE8_9AGAR
MNSTASTISFASTSSATTVKSTAFNACPLGDSDLEENENRGEILDPHSTPKVASSTILTTHGHLNPPRAIRKRKSSCSLEASPHGRVRSHSRAAENALSFQLHLPRSRSGSVNPIHPPPPLPSVESGPINEGAAEKNVIGRVRSGSIGTTLKSNRALRRLPNNPLPPPNAPLPPLPATPANASSPTKPRLHHSKSISCLASRLAGMNVNREPLPPLPPLPTTFRTAGSGAQVSTS